MARAKPTYVAVMDTTLRDGEQTPDVAYTPAEKLQLARLLLDEVGSTGSRSPPTRVSEGEREAARLRRALGAQRRAVCRASRSSATATASASVDWIAGTGGARDEPAGQGLRAALPQPARACRPRSTATRVAQTLRYARRRKLAGERLPRGLVERRARLLRLRVRDGGAAARVSASSASTCPTRSGSSRRDDASRYVGLMTATWPDQCFEFHAHNDYGLATANCLAAMRGGRARRPHQRERHGRAHRQHAARRGGRGDPRPHASCAPGVREDRLSAVSRLVEIFSGKDVAANTPIVGRDVFTQTAGIHADGDLKGDLYSSRLAPARFGAEAPLCAGQALGQGVGRPEPGGARHRPDRRRPRPGPEARHRARRQEGHPLHRRPALHHRRRAQAAGRAAGARGVLVGRRSGTGETPHAELTLDVPRAHREGARQRRRRLRRVHERAGQGGAPLPARACRGWRTSACGSRPVVRPRRWSRP